MAFTVESFRESVCSLVPHEASGLLVAFSGGLDSTVLLHSLIELRDRLPWPVRAIHIDHQLHAESAAWRLQCEQAAAAVQVPFESRVVSLADVAAQGVEAAARTARYAAFAAMLRPREVLLTAHHADDQAETLLLALMRGTGVRGAAGMRAVQSFAMGWHVRPLLPYRRSMLESWARERGLTWLEDPSNSQSRFARNFLRADILPRLEARWPAAVDHLQAAASAFGESAELLDELAHSDWQTCGVERQLDLTALLALSDARQRNLLRWWLREHGARAPSRHALAALRADVTAAALDRVPNVDIDGVRVFRHRALLYAEPLERLNADRADAQWCWREPLSLGPLGRLRAVPTRGDGIAAANWPDVLQVRWRSGGERLRVSGTHSRTLKNLLQEADVLPWWRERLPLICVGDRLCAVADLWTDADMQARSDEPSVRIEWEDRPAIFAVAPARSTG